MKRFVFGMGITLNNNWSIVSKEFCPEAAIDNNPAKWGTLDSVTGLKCFSPEESINGSDVEILITAGDPYAIKSISEQLEQKGIHYYILVDMIKEWTKVIPLPDELQKIKVDGQKIILFNTPEHDNLGDHLIAISELDFLKKYFPYNQIIEITDMEYLWHHDKIRQYVTKEDILLITGGGFMGSLWLYNCENNVRSIISEYPDNRIIIFPQTVFFEDTPKGVSEYEKSKSIYSCHKNLTICAREKASFDTLNNMIDKNKVFMLPDMALLYSNKTIKHTDLQKALICFRQDKESILSESEKVFVENELKKRGYRIEYTSMHEGIVGKEQRRKKVEAKLTEISNAELVVTDTLHCMVSAALTKTECIFFDNLSGKVGNVYKWIDNNVFLHFCNDPSGIGSVLDGLEIGDNHFEIINREAYESKLCSIIKEA